MYQVSLNFNLHKNHGKQKWGVADVYESVVLRLNIRITTAETLFSLYEETMNENL